MRLSPTQAATGALTAAVVAGLLLLPGRLLGTEPGGRTVITLVTTAPAPVEAARVPVPRKPARRLVAQPHVQAAPIRVTTPVSRPVPVTRPTVRRSAARRQTATSPALVARIVKSKPVRKALADASPAAPAPRIVAAAEQPAAAPAPSDGLQQALRDRRGSTAPRAHAPSPWDGGLR